MPALAQSGSWVLAEDGSVFLTEGGIVLTTDDNEIMIAGGRLSIASPGNRLSFPD